MRKSNTLNKGNGLAFSSLLHFLIVHNFAEELEIHANNIINICEL